MTPVIRVLVVDDHALHRDGARSILAQHDDLEVVADADSGEMALTLVDRLVPDVVLMDIRLPGISGIEAARRIRTAHPDVRVLMVSAYDDDEYVRGALEAGASGHLSKTAPGQELVEAIRSVAAGHTVVRPDVLVRLLATAADAPSGPGLTEREREVLDCLGRGMANHQIAAALHISPRTVERHCAALYAKLAVHSRTEAVVTAFAAGLLRGVGEHG
ncbi:MAG TPA: response regulator transcription factor [Propionicimonas sp.]